MIFCVAVACTPTDDTESQFPVCITADGNKIGVGGRKKIFAIDAKTGELIKSAESENRNAAAVCSAKNGIVEVTGEEIKEIEADKKHPRRIVGSTVIGIGSKNNLVSYDGKKVEARSGKTLELKIEDPFDESDDLKMFQLTPEKLDAVERNTKTFTILPVKLLNNNELLVFAGGKARTLPADPESDLFPEIWGFYKVNLEDGEVKKTKAIDKSFYEVSLFRLPVTDASKDGKVAAIASGNTDGYIVYAFDTANGEILLKKGYYEQRRTSENSFDLSGITSLAISKDKTKIAIAEDWYDGGRGRFKAEPLITIYDLKSTEKINEFAVKNRDTIIIDFDIKEIILYSKDDKSVSKFDTETGKEIWNTKLEES